MGGEFRKGVKIKGSGNQRQAKIEGDKVQQLRSDFGKIPSEKIFSPILKINYMQCFERGSLLLRHREESLKNLPKCCKTFSNVKQNIINQENKIYYVKRFLFTITSYFHLILHRTLLIKTVSTYAFFFGIIFFPAMVYPAYRPNLGKISFKKMFPLCLSKNQFQSSPVFLQKKQAPLK